MLQAIAVGPLVFSVPLLLAFGSMALGYAAGRASQGAPRRPRDRRNDRALLLVLSVALVASRVAYVVEWFGAYRQHPLDMLDLRDGGWNIPLGLLVAALYVMARSRTRPERRDARNRRPALVAIGVAMAAYVAGSATAHLFGPPVGGHIASAIQLSALDGTSTGLDRFKGRPTVVNLWATWCGPCRHELPMLVQAQRANPDVHFVFANQGEDATMVDRYLVGIGLQPTNVLIDAKSALARASDAQGWPTTLYLDAAGQLVASDTGELSATKLSQRLAELRAGEAP